MEKDGWIVCRFWWWGNFKLNPSYYDLVKGVSIGMFKALWKLLFLMNK